MEIRPRFPKLDALLDRLGLEPVPPRLVPRAPPRPRPRRRPEPAPPRPLDGIPPVPAPDDEEGRR